MESEWPQGTEEGERRVSTSTPRKEMDGEIWRIRGEPLLFSSSSPSFFSLSLISSPFPTYVWARGVWPHSFFLSSLFIFVVLVVVFFLPLSLSTAPIIEASNFFALSSSSLAPPHPPPDSFAKSPTSLHQLQPSFSPSVCTSFSPIIQNKNRIAPLSSSSPSYLSSSPGKSPLLYSSLLRRQEREDGEKEERTSSPNRIFLLSPSIQSLRNKPPHLESSSFPLVSSKSSSTSASSKAPLLSSIATPWSVRCSDTRETQAEKREEERDLNTSPKNPATNRTRNHFFPSFYSSSSSPQKCLPRSRFAKLGMTCLESGENRSLYKQQEREKIEENKKRYPLVSTIAPPSPTSYYSCRSSRSYSPYSIGHISFHIKEKMDKALKERSLHGREEWKRKERNKESLSFLHNGCHFSRRRQRMKERRRGERDATLCHSGLDES